LNEVKSGIGVAAGQSFPDFAGAQSGPRLLVKIRGPRGRAMKLHYYPETDSLYIELASAPGAEAREIVDGLVVDFDADGNVVGLDIDHASRKLDLSKVETVALPPASAAE
jgi:uncharacterized protein YuzE